MSIVMNEKLRKLLQEYQQRRWFPSKYPDPLGEIVDFVNQETVDKLLTDNQRLVDYYLYSMIPPLKFREQCNDYLKAQEAAPRFPFYHLQATEQSEELWDSLRKWCVDWKSVLQGWLEAVIGHEKAWKHSAQLPVDLE